MKSINLMAYQMLEKEEISLQWQGIMNIRKPEVKIQNSRLWSYIFVGNLVHGVVFIVVDGGAKHKISYRTPRDIIFPHPQPLSAYDSL